MNEDIELEKDDLHFIKSTYAKDLVESSSYKEVLLYAFKCLERRTFLDIKKVKEEIKNIENIPIDIRDLRGGETDMITFQQTIAKIDGFRSRLSDLLSSSRADFDAVDHWYDQLQDVWIARSDAKSLDKRKGESAEILSFLLPEKLKRKEIYEIVKNKFNLMGYKMEAISREITIGLELRKSKIT